ncbi:FCS-Like Zinc finger 10 [Arabidopsis thaliana]
MSQHSNYQMTTASDYYSTKPVLSAIRSHKLISSVFEGKCPSDYESAWSPTSPLDFRLFSTLGNPFAASSSRSIWKGKQRSWDSGKVGLSIVHSLVDDHHTDSSARIVLPSPDSKNIIFGSLMRSGQKPHLLSQPFTKALMPKDVIPNAVFEIGHDVIDVLELRKSGSVDAAYCSGAENFSVNNNACQVTKQDPGSLNGGTESDMEISEDYTRVISHGPNPKTTHFYGDQVMESVEREELKNRCCKNEKESIFAVAPLDLTTPVDVLPPKDFLSFCCGCSKKLGMGEDIYMYSGYKAFCSSECRSKEIDLDEEMEDGDEEEAIKSVSSSDKESKKKSNGVFFTVG